MRVSSLQWGKLDLGSSIFSCSWQHEKCGIQVISQMNDSYWWWFYGGLPFFVICLVYLRVMIPFIRNSLDRFNHQVSQSFWQRTSAVNSQPTSMEKGSVVREFCSKKGLSFRLFCEFHTIAWISSTLGHCKFCHAVDHRNWLVTHQTLTFFRDLPPWIAVLISLVEQSQ